MKRRLSGLLACILLILAMIPSVKAYAGSPTDEILNYEITVDVLDNATLRMQYHIDWKVLKSDGSLGPLTWVKIGLPNSHTDALMPASGNISKASLMHENGEYFARIDFNQKYYKDEVASFDFEVLQDYMYEMNVLTEGETVYYFVPGWFNDIAVDNITVKWNADKSIGNSHGATLDNGYLVWTDSLSAGEKLAEISVTYPSDAFSFDESKFAETAESNQNYNYNDDYSSSSDAGDAIAALIFLAFPVFIIWRIASKIKEYASGSGLSSSTKTTKKITRTLIKYYPTCPGCGAARPEGKEKCDYCGRSFIESEEVVEEKEIKEPAKYNNEGLFRYGDSPNTYVRVHVTHIPVPRTRSSCVHSSCAHSSCACAHSCACACACACAGGGRAGCSTKDFYNTNLKLSQLKRRMKKG